MDTPGLAKVARGAALKWIVRSGLIVFSGCGGAACAADDATVRPQVRTRSEFVRQTLFQELQPVTLDHCELKRFGETHDGGYLLCGNLLAEVRSAYSYGISGYDGWGCEVSRQLEVPVHQYDCFDTRRTSCDGGNQIFHEACIADRTFTDEGRAFDTLQRQIAGNGDAGKRVVVKMDVEGAEWDSLIGTPAEVLSQIDQLAIELHGVEDARFVVGVQRLKEYFHVVNLHFNNYSCADGLAPFPATAYEVLFVNKRFGPASNASAPARPHALDTPNASAMPDCQAVTSTR